MINVTIFNEFIHEKQEENVAKIYPDGIHEALKKGIEGGEIAVRTATHDNINEALSEEILRDTDVLLWWGHIKHNDVPDEIALRVRDEAGIRWVVVEQDEPSLGLTRMECAKTSIEYLKSL